MKLAIFVKNLLNIQIHGEEMSNLRPKIVSRALKECTKYGTPKKDTVYGVPYKVCILSILIVKMI